MKYVVLLVLLLLAVTVSADGSKSGVSVYTYINSADTLNDTVSGNGKANIVDTSGLIQLYNSNFTTQSMICKIFLEVSGNAKRGYGLSDSGYIRLYTRFQDESHLLTQDSCNALPCSLRYIIPSSTAGVDTLLKEDLLMVVEVSDTTSDTVMTADHKVTFKYFIKDD